MLSSWTSSITRTENLSTSQLPWTRFLPRWVASTGRLMNTGLLKQFYSNTQLIHRTNESLMLWYFSFGLEQSVLDNQVAWTDRKQVLILQNHWIFPGCPAKCAADGNWRLVGDSGKATNLSSSLLSMSMLDSWFELTPFVIMSILGQYQHMLQ